MSYNYQNTLDEVCDLITDPGSEFYTLCSWDESGRVAAIGTLNAPIAEELAGEVAGIEALDAHTIRLPY